ncbi:hypothetical protein EOD08_34025 [Mesorhizobium sp. M6A.T.Ca.TU.002.02.2.1]|nr:hypothetical protein EOD08_34025 [Mesorhizobium sp. M6A.T.Ca.TU.002.02.2.1]
MITHQQPVGCLSTTSRALARPIVERMADRVLELSRYGTAVTKDVLFKHTDFTREEIERHALEACDLARARAVCGAGVFQPLSPRQELISECEGLGLDGKAPPNWRETYSDAQLRAAINWLDEVGTAADRLIAAAATSPELEASISRQLTGGRKPSEILAALDAGGVNA